MLKLGNQRRGVDGHAEHGPCDVMSRSQVLCMRDCTSCPVRLSGRQTFVEGLITNNEPLERDNKRNSPPAAVKLVGGVRRKLSLMCEHNASQTAVIRVNAVLCHSNSTITF